VPLIAANAEPAGGSLLHLAGAQLAFDLKEALEHEGFTVSQPVVYRSQAATSFDPQVADAIRSSLLDGVILLSPRTAEIFVTLATKAGLAEAARKLTFYCMSDAVARPLDALAPININIAAQPNSQEILALIARMAPESG
jgi:uroporphyrinogen-III synthase